MPTESSVNEFIEAMLAGDGEGAARLRDDDPALPTSTVHAAAVSGETGAIAAMLMSDPSLATAKGGPRSWEPILYASFSRAGGIDRSRNASLAEAVRLLLEAGADPNTSYIEEFYPDSPQTALYGAAGVANNPAAVEVLLVAGANPNDGESIYHAAEGNHRECLELLAEHGADLSARGMPWNNTPLYFLFGYREGNPRGMVGMEGVRWLLEHGANPNVTSYDVQETPLHLAIRNGWSRPVIAMLLDHGADPNLRNAMGITPYAMAIRFGNRDAAALLAEREAEQELTVVDRLLGAAMEGDEGKAREIIAEHPGLTGSLGRGDFSPLITAAIENNLRALRTMLDVGFDIAARGDAGATALHHAAWRGRREAVELLLDYNPPLDMRCEMYQGTPMDWALHGSLNACNPEGDYPAIVERLIAAGGEVSKVDWGSPAVIEVLRRARERGPGV